MFQGLDKVFALMTFQRTVRVGSSFTNLTSRSRPKYFRFIDYKVCLSRSYTTQNNVSNYMRQESMVRLAMRGVEGAGYHLSSTNLIRKGISGWVFTVPTVGYWIPAKFQQISLSMGSSNAKDPSKVTSTTSVVQVSRHTLDGELSTTHLFPFPQICNHYPCR